MLTTLRGDNHPATILVVDDDPVSLGLITEQLHERGFQVAISRNGKSGLERAEQLQPDLILLDVQMSDLDGFETCRRLKANDHTREIPVIFLTVHIEMSDIVRGFEVGGVDYITKPFHVQELLARINTHVTIHKLQQQLETQNARLQQEMTERKRVEKALQESEERYRSVVEDQTEVISRFKSDGTFVFVNDIYCRFFGKTETELLGKKWMPVAHPDDLPMINAKLAEMSVSNPVVLIENRVFSATGALHWMQFVNRGFYDHDGNLQEIQSVGRDITKRKQAEEALHRNETLFRAIVEQSGEGISLADIKGNYVSVNPAFCKVTGYSNEELLKMNVEDLLPPHVKLSLFPKVARNQSGRREVELLKKDGSYFMAEVEGYPINLPEQNLVLGIVRDITERKRAEDALRESEEFNRITLSNISDAVYLTDNNGDFVFVCPNVDIIFGYSRDEVLSIGNITKILGPDRFDSLALERCQEMPNVEYEITDKLGNPHSLLVNIKQVSIRNGTRLYVCRDITKRKQIEKALRQSEDQFRGAFETAAHGMALVSPEGNFIRINYAFCGIVGYNCEEMLSLDFQTITHPDDLNTDLAFVQQLLLDEIPTYQMEKRYIHKLGHIMWVLLSVSLVRDSAGQPVHFVAQVIDITERKRTEKALQEAKKEADAANHAKSRFLANMSHELRSPLNAILGFAQITAYNPSLDKESRDNLAIINRSGEHLLMLINQVLDLSKIEAGHISLNETDFGLHPLLADLEDMFKLRAKNKQLQLRFEQAGNLPQYIHADEIKLRQVLINLLNNALKFTKIGSVTVQIDNEAADGPVAGSHIRFRVSDTGPGIAPEEMDSLFEAFMQTETGRQAQEGTGLGLSISQKFVELMGSEIAVTSEVGQGTTFTFTIQAKPVAEVDINKLKANRHQQVIALEPGQPSYRILIVDDRPVNRELLIQLLNPLGFELREAENGQQAVEIYEAWQPHLIWMDLRMPVMNGYEASRQIKATTKGQPTVIIALTASMAEESSAVMLSTGLDDFLRKPFRKQDIFDLMSQHIGVRFVYENEILPETRETINDLATTLIDLPSDLLMQLYSATEECHPELIERVISDIGIYQPATADILLDWANDFQYEKILALLQDIR